MGDVINPEEFSSQVDNKTNSEIIQWDDFESDFDKVGYNGELELLDDLIRHHRHDARLDPQKTIPAQTSTLFYSIAHLVCLE